MLVAGPPPARGLGEAIPQVEHIRPTPPRFMSGAMDALRRAHGLPQHWQRDELNRVKRK